jgi:transcriptional regulator with XRE-family HTH domain
MNDVPQITGEQIKTFRKKNGLTQQQVGHFVGCIPLTVGRWESGEAKPSDRHLIALQRLLSSETLSPEMFEPRPINYSPFPMGNYPIKPSVPSLEEETEVHLRDLRTILTYFGTSPALKSTIIESLMDLVLLDDPDITQSDKSPWRRLMERAFSELPPYPKTQEEIARRNESQITVTVDNALLDGLLEQAENRRFTPSGLLEVILWNYLGKPKLSFEKDTSSAEGKTESQAPEKDSGDDPAGSDRGTDM